MCVKQQPHTRIGLFLSSRSGFGGRTAFLTVSFGSFCLSRLRSLGLRPTRRPAHPASRLLVICVRLTVIICYSFCPRVEMAV